MNRKQKTEKKTGTFITHSFYPPSCFPLPITYAVRGFLPGPITRDKKKKRFKGLLLCPLSFPFFRRVFFSSKQFFGFVSRKRQRERVNILESAPFVVVSVARDLLPPLRVMRTHKRERDRERENPGERKQSPSRTPPPLPSPPPPPPRQHTRKRKKKVKARALFILIASWRAGPGLIPPFFSRFDQTQRPLRVFLSSQQSSVGINACLRAP